MLLCLLWQKQLHWAVTGIKTQQINAPVQPDRCTKHCWGMALFSCSRSNCWVCCDSLWKNQSHSDPLVPGCWRKHVLWLPAANPGCMGCSFFPYICWFILLPLAFIFYILGKAEVPTQSKNNWERGSENTPQANVNTVWHWELVGLACNWNAVYNSVHRAF